MVFLWSLTAYYIIYLFVWLLIGGVIGGGGGITGGTGGTVLLLLTMHLLSITTLGNTQHVLLLLYTVPLHYWHVFATMNLVLLHVFTHCPKSRRGELVLHRVQDDEVHWRQSVGH